MNKKPLGYLDTKYWAGTVEVLADKLHYSPETGHFFRRRKLGLEQVQALDQMGNPVVHVNGIRYLCSVLAWMWVNQYEEDGKIRNRVPSGRVKHINGDVTDNRAVNLYIVDEVLEKTEGVFFVPVPESGGRDGTWEVRLYDKSHDFRISYGEYDDCSVAMAVARYITNELAHGAHPKTVKAILNRSGLARSKLDNVNRYFCRGEIVFIGEDSPEAPKTRTDSSFQVARIPIDKGFFTIAKLGPGAKPIKGFGWPYYGRFTTKEEAERHLQLFHLLLDSGLPRAEALAESELFPLRVRNGHLELLKDFEIVLKEQESGQADYKLSLPFVFAAQGENEGVTYMMILHNLNKSFTSATDPGSQEQVTMGATRYVLALAEDVYSKRTPNYERALSLAGLTEIQL